MQKSHKKKKAVGFADGFQRIKEKILDLIEFFLRDFCSALNETVP